MKGMKDFTDRKSLIQAVGVYYAIGGIICLLFALIIPLSMKLANHSSPDFQMSGSVVSLSLMVYLLMAVFFSYLAIGCLTVKKWVRPVSLIVFWGALITGVFTMVIVPVMMSFMKIIIEAEGGRAVYLITVAVMMSFLFVLFIVIPVLMIYFFTRSSVCLSFEKHDPVQRWTDHVSVPVLSLMLISGFAACTSLVMAVAGTPFPVFSKILQSFWVRLFWLGIAGFYGLIFWGAWNTKKWAWASGFAFYTLYSIIMTFTVISGTFNVYLAEMGGAAYSVPEVTGKTIRMMIWVMPVSTALYVGYFLWLRKYFFKAE